MDLTTRQKTNLRYEYLGETQCGRFTPLTSDLEPYQVKFRADSGALVADSFAADPTDWGGCDDLDRVCKLKKCNIDQTFELKVPIDINGCDVDCGITTNWKITIVKIHTIKDKSKECHKRFSETTVAAEGIAKYTVGFQLNGISTQAIFDSLHEVLDYLDYLVETGGDVTNVQISEERKLILE